MFYTARTNARFLTMSVTKDYTIVKIVVIARVYSNNKYSFL